MEAGSSNVWPAHPRSAAHMPHNISLHCCRLPAFRMQRSHRELERITVWVCALEPVQPTSLLATMFLNTLVVESNDRIVEV